MWPPALHRSEACDVIGAHRERPRVRTVRPLPLLLLRRLQCLLLECHAGLLRSNSAYRLQHHTAAYRKKYTVPYQNDFYSLVLESDYLSYGLFIRRI